MEISVNGCDGRTDAQKMSRKKKLVIGILVFLFIATAYLNLGYLIAGDIDRNCRGMVGSGLTETVMGDGAFLFCGNVESGVGMAMWQWRLIEITWPFVIAISAGQWLFLFIFDGGLINLLAIWPN